MTFKSFASVFGPLLSGIYLVVCFILGNSVVSSDESAIGFGSLLILITTPWSFLLAKLLTFNADNFILIVATGAFFNAIILYILGLLITRLVRALKAKSREQLP
jgi:hypothetical protein